MANTKKQAPEPTDDETRSAADESEGALVTQRETDRAELARLGDFLLSEMPDGIEEGDPGEENAVDVAIRLLRERMPVTLESTEGEATVAIKLDPGEVRESLRSVLQIAVVSQHKPDCRRHEYDRPYSWPTIFTDAAGMFLSYRCNDAECTGVAQFPLEEIDSVVFDALGESVDLVEDQELDQTP